MPRRVAFGASVAAGALAFAAIVFLDRDRYLRHERWTDFQLLQIDPRVGNPVPVDPTVGGEFVTTSYGLELNPKIALRVEEQLNEAERASLRSEARRPFFGKSQPHDWLTRVCSVLRKDDRILVRLHLTDADLAERVGRVLADQIVLYGIRSRLEEQMMEVERLMREVERLGDNAPSGMKQELREASMGTGMQPLHIRKADGFYPKASDGKRVVWPRLAEAAAQAAICALLGGAPTWWLISRFRKPAAFPVSL